LTSLSLEGNKNIIKDTIHVQRINTQTKFNSTTLMTKINFLINITIFHMYKIIQICECASVCACLILKFKININK